MPVITLQKLHRQAAPSPSPAHAHGEGGRNLLGIQLRLVTVIAREKFPDAGPGEKTQGIPLTLINDHHFRRESPDSLHFGSAEIAHLQNLSRRLHEPEWRIAQRERHGKHRRYIAPVW